MNDALILLCAVCVRQGEASLFPESAVSTSGYVWPRSVQKRQLRKSPSFEKSPLIELTADREREFIDHHVEEVGFGGKEKGDDDEGGGEFVSHLGMWGEQQRDLCTTHIHPPFFYYSCFDDGSGGPKKRRMI